MLNLIQRGSASRSRPSASSTPSPWRHAAARVTGFVGLLVLLAIAGWTEPVRAQSTAQVQLIGVPPQLSAVQFNTLVRNYQAGMYPVQFIYSEPSGRAATFRFELRVRYNGSIVLNLTSDPVTVQPGVYTYQTFQDTPAVRFPGGLNTLLQNLDGPLRRRINESGRLPEGEYEIVLEPRAADPTRLISVLPGRATVTARVAEPPVLITPVNGARVTEPTPQFSWSPATGLPAGIVPQYVLRIVEMDTGQEPFRALRGNIPHVETIVAGTTTFTYLPNELPLEEGCRYVWQITARDAEGTVSFADRGETEIYTFTYGSLQRDPYVWRYPSEANSLFEVEISQYVTTDFGIRVSGVYRGTVEGEPVSFDFGAESDPATFDVDGESPNATLQLTGGTVKLSNGMTITPGN